MAKPSQVQMIQKFRPSSFVNGTESYEKMPNVIRLIGRKAIHFIAFNVTTNIINQ